MNFFEELAWRGMLQDHTPGVQEHLDGGMRTGYIGFDPTAPSLTIGNYVQIMLLTLFQRSGHRPIVLMGGATGRIGDPSGKDKERELKSYDEIDGNLEHQKKLIYRFLNFEEGPNRALLVNNYDFYQKMNVLDFLRDVGKTLTVNYMMSKESVRKRIETGISFTEFSYQLLQGYDYQCLFREHGCTVQMGGSDQWGNITAGTEFIRKNLGESAFAMTTPLLTKADGSKFGKSEKGNLWIDDQLTTTYQFYQFWINTEDADVLKFLRWFTFLDQDSIAELEQAHEQAPHQRPAQRALARHMTELVHGAAAVSSVEQAATALFGQGDVRALAEDMLRDVFADVPHSSHSKALLDGAGISLLDLLVDTSLAQSKREAREFLQNGAIAVNGEKADLERKLNTSDLLHGHTILLRRGKKNWHATRWA